MKNLDNCQNELLQFTPQLRSFAFNFIKEESLAEDLVQDTLFKAIKYFPQYQQGTNMKAWLFMIMRNTFINTYKKVKKERNVIDVVEDISSFQQNRSFSNNNGEVNLALEDINLALSKLPKEQYLAFIQYFEGYKYHEIAESLKIPIGTVKTRIHQARIALKANLKNYK